ncbi:PadR family transcriptional regulator [Faecalimonas sp.]
MQARDNLKKGSLEMLILKLLSICDCYGYQLTQILKKLSNGVLSVPSGSLYPALYKLLDNNYISEYSVKVGKRQERIYYHLEDKGKLYLEEQIESYRLFTLMIENILQYTGEKNDNS